MPNQNPIHLNEGEVLTPFLIPSEYGGKELTLTVEIVLDANNWIYRSNSNVFLNSSDLFPGGTPEPESLPLGIGANLAGKQLLVKTKVSRIYTPGGATGAVPKVKFILHINSGSNSLAAFEMQSGSENPSKFNSLLQFTI